jgi:hypothetical protein
MPLVQPDIKGTRRRLAVDFESELLLRLRAYALMRQARPDAVVRVALVRLFEADKEEFEAYLKAHPGALDSRRLSRTDGSQRKPAAELETALLIENSSTDRSLSCRAFFTKGFDSTHHDC